MIAEVLPGGEEFVGCYHDCGARTDGATMDRVCDELGPTDVASVEACHALCAGGGYKYMGLACPRASAFECWCCDLLDVDSVGRSGLIAESECSGGGLTSGINGNDHAHCSGFDGAAAGGYDLGGYFLGGHCRAAVYNVVASAATETELTAFDCRGECALDQRIDDAVLRTDIVGLRAVTADGASHTWALAGTTLEALLHQDWHGVAGEDDRFKLLAGGADIHQSLYMFDDGDAVNYAGDAACPAASMAGHRQEDCPGTPVGLISMHNPARDDLTGDYGACDLRTDWGFLVAALFVEPSGRPPPPPPPPSPLEEVAFDNRGQCNVAQVVPAALLAKPIRSIRVERVDGGTASWDVLTFEGTLGEMLDVGHWHGVAGETDQFKLLAGESSHPNQNLYVFNDNDAANYDADGCAAAAMPFGTPQISGCAGTPHGLFSMGHHQTDLAGDYGECNYRGDWGWVVKAMWLTPA